MAKHIIAILGLAFLAAGVQAEVHPITAVMPEGTQQDEVLLPPSGDPELDAIIWTIRAPYPYSNGTYRSAACGDGHYYYMCGGWVGITGSGGPRNTLHRYDPVSNTWTQLANMPGGNSNHTMIYYPPGHKIYVVAGYNGSSAMNVNWEYDIATNTWTARAPIPRACYGTAGAVLGDSVFVVTGGDLSSQYGKMYRYDVSANAWEERVSPGSGQITHGGMVELGGYLYYIGGWTASTRCMRYDVATNSWTTRASRPVGGHGIGIAAFAGKIYAYGGGNLWSSRTNQCNVYNPMTNTWITETPMPYALGASSISGRVGVYMFYTSGQSASPPNIHIRGLFPDVHNVAVGKILAPAGAVDSGQVVTPEVIIYNFGTFVETNFNTYLEIEGGYLESVNVPSIGPGVADTLAFPDYTPHARDSLTVTAWTLLPGDEVPEDDTMSLRFLVRVKDVAVTDILAPVGTLPPGVIVWPRCRVHNYGNQTQTFDVEFRIGAYQNTVSVNNLIPGGARTMTASESLITKSGAWIHRVEAILAGDLHPDNNVMYDTFYVTGTPEHDVAAEAILAPVGFCDTLTTVTPSARVANYGGQPETFWTFFSVWDMVTDELVYQEALQVSLGGGANTVVNYPNTVFKVLGMHTSQCSVYLAEDQNVLNNVEEDSFEVIATEHNVLVEQITSPTGAIDSGAVVTPSVVVRNAGLHTETFNTYFTIEGGYSAVTNVSNLGPGDTRSVEFTDWTANVRDSVEAVAWTLLTGDERPEDDTLSAKFFVQVRDVGVEEVIAPVDTLAEGIWVHPECRVRNYGSTVETFDVEFRIGLWLGMATVTDLAPGDYEDVVMVESLQTQVGIWLDRAYTTLAGDMNPGNNTALDTFWVLGTITHDVGVAEILAPTGTIDTLTTVTPKARVGNYGTETETWWTYFRVLDPTGGEAYSEALEMTLPPTGEVVLEFPDVRFTVPGVYVSRCSTYLATDQNWTNNLAVEEFEVGDPTIWEPGWREMKPMPTLPSGKPVKRGGWLAIDGSGTIFAAKGYKTGDYYSYDPILNTWTQRALIPWQHHPNPRWARKPPRKGAKGVCDGNNYIYMTQGNNTLGFWRYDIPGDSWDVLPDVPFGKFRKKVKGGTDLAYVTLEDSEYVYLLKGYKTEFYRYNVESQKWDTLADAPTGKRAKWNKGSWLCKSPGSPSRPFPVLYAHKARYHELWQYHVPGDSWYSDTLAGMPFLGLHSGRIRKKKSKDGGSGDWYDGDIYALKGGNTQQFWKYIVARDSWKELDTMPTYGTTGRRKRVKYGADIVSYGYGAFFALKGNKTSEFWRYVLPRVLAENRPTRSGAMAGGQRSVECGLRITPNPLAGGFVTLRYSLPKAGPAHISIFDVVGRAKSQQAVLAGRTGAVSLDLRSLSAGVYLVRLDADGFTATRKLVVQH